MIVVFIKPYKFKEVIVLEKQDRIEFLCPNCSIGKLSFLFYADCLSGAMSYTFIGNAECPNCGRKERIEGESVRSIIIKNGSLSASA
jgi:rubredoxin